MPESPTGLAARLRREGEKTLEFFHSLPPECWEQVIYSEDAPWSVRQLLAHLVGAEAGMTALARDILAGGTGTPEVFDLDAYNRRKVAALEALSPQELLERYQALRGASVELVESLSAEVLQRVGRHPWLGVVPLEEIFKMLYIHNHIHQRDIRRLISSDNPE